MDGDRFSLTASAAVAGPPDAVYERVANPAHRKAWMVELKTDAPSRQLTEGDQFDGTTSVLGHSFVGRSQVEEAEAGRVLRERVMIGARVASTWTFTTEGTQTRVDHRLDVELPRGPLAPIARLILRRRLAALQRQSLAGLDKQF